MPLTPEHVRTTSQEGSSSHVREGIYVEEVEVIKAEDMSGKTPDWGDFTNDLAIEITYMPVDRDLPFEPSIYIGQDFKIGAGGEKEWGGAHFVAQAVKTILGGADFELAADDTFKQETLRALIGQTYLQVSYRSEDVKDDGNNRIKAWRTPIKQQEGETLEDARERAADKFLRSYLDSGYPKDYLSENQAKAQESGFSTDVFSGGDGASAGQETDPFEPGDELPF
jgi:hypothetical protein